MFVVDLTVLRMNVFVVNIGSTSLKFRLVDMATESERMRGAVDGVGALHSWFRWRVTGEEKQERTGAVGSQTKAVDLALSVVHESAEQHGCSPIDVVGFKAVHGGELTEAIVDKDVLSAMHDYSDLAPAHNPAYAEAMWTFAEALPQTPLVAIFEPGFHRTIDEARRVYAVPFEWKAKYGVQRWGFHGASHRYVAEMVCERVGRDDLRVISCHLGGSSSICAIRGVQSVANSFGMTPQSGLPQNNRVGELDAFALPHLAKRTGMSIETLLKKLASEGGLLGISGESNDMRVLLQKASEGHERCALAVEAYVQCVRDYLGAYIVLLGGLDVLVFTGGIGERSDELRRRVCQGLAFLGIELDESRNANPGDDDAVSSADAPVLTLAVETNEELMVARRAAALVAKSLNRSVAGG